MNRPGFFDLETGWSEKAATLKPSEDDLNAGIRSDFKPETAEKYRKQNAESWAEECRKRASLDWRMGIITAIGLHPEDQPNASILINGRDGDEAMILGTFWDLIHHYSIDGLIGFNLRSFDVPWIMGRSAVLGVEIGRYFDLKRYGNYEVLDWCEVLANHDPSRTRGWTLGRYAEWFELGVEMFGDGADVPTWFAAGELDKIEAHLRGDLRAIKALHERFPALAGLKGQVA